MLGDIITPIYPILAIPVLLMLASLVIKILIGNPRKKKSKKINDESYPFESVSLMTITEKAFYKELKAALPEYTVFAQVGLSRVIRVKRGHNHYYWFNRINRMSLDYLVVDESLETVAAIELDDASHNSKKAKERDAKKNKALEAAGINLIRWHVQNKPNRDEIRKTLSL